MRFTGQGALWDKPHAMLDGVVRQVERVVFGKRKAIEHLLVALLCEGHALLEDVPGVGKTLLAKSTAAALGFSFRRIQCTPDLLPSDITGVSIFRKATETFEYRPGPLMANLVLADELNRTSPKTQSALLEAMEERRVTVDGETHALPRPFMVVATQNPIGFEGAYPLPEAQLDRFLLRIRLGYPSAEDEAAMLEGAGARGEHGELAATGSIGERGDAALHSPPLRAVLLPEEFAALQRAAAEVHVDEAVKMYIVSLTRATRARPELALGASPRASLALFRASRALALLRGRSYVLPDDCRELAAPVLAHRLVLRQEAGFAGHTQESVLAAVVGSVPVPSMPASGSLAKRIGGAV